MFKIVSQLGKPIQRDEATTKRDKFQFARVLVEVQMDQPFPTTLSFFDDHGMKVDVDVSYEWKPSIRNSCHKVGHDTKDCRMPKPRKIWVQKIHIQSIQPVEQITQEKVVEDPGDFQRAFKPIRVRVSHHKATHINNVFELLRRIRMERCKIMMKFLLKWK